MTLTEHRLFGHVLLPYFIRKNTHGAFYTVVTPVLKADVDAQPELLDQARRRLVELTENYSDENLARRFSRKLGSKEFFQKVDNDFFNKHITPYIDKQVVACINLIRKHDVPLYFKPVKYNNIYEEDRIEVLASMAHPVFHFNLGDEGLTYHLSITHEGKPFPLLYKKPVIVSDTPCRLVLRNQLIGFEKLSGKRLTPFLTKEKMNIPAAVTDKYLRSFVAGIVRDHEVQASGFDVIAVDSEKKAFVLIEQGLTLEPILILVFQYGKRRFKAGRKGNVEVELINNDGHYTFFKHQRDAKWEAEIIDFLKKRQLSLSGDQLELTAQANPLGDENRYAIINWINRYSADLVTASIGLEQHLPQRKYFTGHQELKFDMRMEGDWFDIYALVTLGSYKVPFIRLKKNILQGRREYTLPNGEVVILPLEWFGKYQSLLPFTEGNDEQIRLSKHHFALIGQELKGVDTETAEKIQALKTTDFGLCDEPEGLNATLRHYQKEGYSWMHTMKEKGFGACLADDMGLGKTLQTLALLLNLKQQNKKELLPNEKGLEQSNLLFDVMNDAAPASLVVVPTSLIHNWQNELQRFTPQLKIYQHVGTQRKRIASLKGILSYYDVIITTYGTIRNDYELFGDLFFNYIILDESQYIKNSGSLTYKAVCALQSEYKLVLTGTPIENSLSDLWSQMNFLNRGLLGSMQFFKKEYLQPIEKNGDEEKQKELYQMISPFILRRTKEEVARDLPPLTEQIRYCEMNEAQQKIYEREKSAIRNSLFENIEKQGIEKSSFLVLQGLTRLRQLANHPALVGFKQSGSGKFDAVMRSLENLMAEKHKVLIFSSFVTHLKLFQQELDEQGWNYCLLTGQTRDRETVINNFQNNDKNRIFLISLKAGGVGLNLTSADYIFILDPWWNPAAENQAINRAHRIGQNKKVFVYRFITEESIEEKIQLLKERKSALADQFIQSNNPFQSISKDELVEMFS
jgi:superfamily II DNA or RNA helicase